MAYVEGIFWYVLFADCIIYNIMCWVKKKWKTHWLSEWFPLNKFFGIFYLFLILWTGFTLYRMKLLGFYFS
jgi:hypothetical protein